MRPVFKAAVPVLAVEDLGEALEYYKHVLGFQVGWTWGDPPHLASVCRDNVELNLGQKGKAGPPGASRVYFQMDGVDEYYEQVKTAGAKIMTPRDDRPDGMRDFNLQDPNGTDLGVGELTVSHGMSLTTSPSGPRDPSAVLRGQHGADAAQQDVSPRAGSPERRHR